MSSKRGGNADSAGSEDDRSAVPVDPPKKRRGLLAPDEPLEGESTRVRAERPTYDPAEGRGIIGVSWIGTIVFTVSALFGMIRLSTAIACVIVSLVLFAIGTVAFIAAFLRAANRSRYEAIGMGGLYFLAGATAPARVQALLLGSLGVQTAVAFIAASVRMYTGLAFGILVPMFGLGMAGLWGARYGRFAEREPDPVKPPPASTKSGVTSGTKSGAKSTKRSSAESRQQPTKKPPRVR